MTGSGTHALGQCYSLRRANPFRGLAAVAKTATGRAISIHGLEWQVQVLAQPPKGLWSAGGRGEQPFVVLSLTDKAHQERSIS